MTAIAAIFPCRDRSQGLAHPPNGLGRSRLGPGVNPGRPPSSTTTRRCVHDRALLHLLQIRSKRSLRLTVGTYLRPPIAEASGQRMRRGVASGDRGAAPRPNPELGAQRPHPAARYNQSAEGVPRYRGPTLCAAEHRLSRRRDVGSDRRDHPAAARPPSNGIGDRHGTAGRRVGSRLGHIALNRIDSETAQGPGICLGTHDGTHLVSVLAKARNNVPADDTGGADNRYPHQSSPRAGRTPICLSSVARS